MAVKASAHITLNSVVDIKATYRYYLLQSSTLSKPSKPTANPPGGSWDDAEPTYTSGSTNSLYYVDLTVFSDDTFLYSEVSLSTSYEAAKEAYNKAGAAQDSANAAQGSADLAQDTADKATENVRNAMLDIDTLEAMISSLVVGSNGATLMEQTDSGWRFNFGAFQEALNNATNDVGNLNSEMTDVNSQLSSVIQNVDDLGVYTNYITFGTDANGQPCITLGEKDSPFKVVITNTDIRFMEGSTVPASISNQALNINKAVIEDELSQGGFSWVTRSNGNYGLVWKGE